MTIVNPSPARNARSTDNARRARIGAFFSGRCNLGDSGGLAANAQVAATYLGKGTAMPADPSGATIAPLAPGNAAPPS